MKLKAFSPSLTLLWRVTAGVAVLLLVTTFMLVVKARITTTTGVSGYISDQSTIVFLRSQPTDSSQIVAIINSGTQVYVDNSTTRDGLTWFHIETKSDSGWILKENLSLTDQ